MATHGLQPVWRALCYARPRAGFRCGNGRVADRGLVRFGVRGADRGALRVAAMVLKDVESAGAGGGARAGWQ